MNILFNLHKFLLSPADENGGGAGGDAGAASGGGNVRESRPAKQVEDIYGQSEEAGGDEPAAGAGDAPAGGKGEGDENNFADDEEPKGEEGAEGEEKVDGEEEPAAGGEEGEEEEEVEKGKEKLLKLDPESIAALRGERPEGEKKQQMSQEELKKLINPVEVTDDLVAEIRSENPEVAKKALQGLMNAAVKNAFSLTRLMMQKKEQEFMATLSPLMQQQQANQLRQTQENFYKFAPHLTKYKAAVKMAASEVNPNNADGSSKSEKQIFKEVSAKAIASLKSLGVNIQMPNANPGAGAGKPTQVKGAVPGPNKLSAPGRSGGGGDNSNKNTKSDQADIYSR